MRLTVLSPHRDDATFSLAMALKRWSRAGVEITIINFFTRSIYAPYAPEDTDISALRAREDRRSVAVIDTRIRLLSLWLLDAPLRLSIDFGSLTNPNAFAPITREIVTLSRRIGAFMRKSLVLAPLALGDHIDHRTIHQAALCAGAGGQSLGFYEDLPYATWTDEAVIRQRVSAAEGHLHSPLVAACQQSQGWRFKERVVRQYSSQIDRAMARSIAKFSEKYRGAERIWVPRHSARWLALLKHSQ